MSQDELSRARKKPKHWHAHGCVRCHIRYVDACDRPGQDEQCVMCRGGCVWQQLIDNAAPKDCCVRTARIVTKDEKRAYYLAGAHLWWICTVCKRTHPYNPRRPENQEQGGPA